MLKIILKLGIKIIEVLMNKQVTKNTIKKLQEETLKNILSSKGIIYQHYLRFLQRKHQSNHQYYLPTLPLK